MSGNSEQSPSRASKRLAAILHADIVGYTEITGREEEWTVKTISEARSRFEARIVAHGGRLVSTPGDAVLAEFTSVTEAVIASVEIQQGFSRTPLVSPQGHLLQFRIGLHLADIYPDGNDILGDGVNIAARLESAADPGGVCFSGSVYEQIRDKLDILCSDLGERSFKNVSRPIKVYRLDIPPDQPGPAAPPHLRAGSALVVPYRPTVAVLPFANLSGSSDDDYFADGITDNIINTLSQSRWFFVIARGSTFQFRKSSEDIRNVGRILGCRYILQGSVQREATRVRVTTHLMDASAGHLIRSHRHEGLLSDIFDLQDTIALQVASTLEPEILSAESALRVRHTAADATAMDNVLRAYAKLWEWTPKSAREAERLLLAALDIDPKTPQAHIGIAMGATFDVYMGWTDRPAERLSQAAIAASKAIWLDRQDAWAHMAQGLVFMQTNHVEQAVSSLRTALQLNPSLALAYGFLANAMIFAGRGEEAQTLLRLAMRLSPRDTFLVYWLDGMSMVQLMAGRLTDAEHWAERAVRENPSWPGAYRMLAIALGLQGRLEPARAALEEMLKLQPNVSLEYLSRILPFRDQSHLELYVEGLRKAGWDDPGAKGASA